MPPAAPATLDRLMPCQGATIRGIGGDAALRTRLRDLGFREGELVVMVKQAPLADPVEYRVQGAHVSLRREEARLIQVVNVRAVPWGFGWGRGRRRRRGWWRRGFLR